MRNKSAKGIGAVGGSKWECMEQKDTGRELGFAEISHHRFAGKCWKQEIPICTNSKRVRKGNVSWSSISFLIAKEQGVYQKE